jgi:uncharacterized membrane protein YcaP (DUF421 family)
MAMDQILSSMLTMQLPASEKILRPILVYLVLVALLRIFGKRELAQLNSFDLVVLMCLANTVQNAIIGNDNSLLGGIAGAFALLGFNYLVVRFVLRHRRLDRIIEGRPVVLIRNGVVQLKALASEMLTTHDLHTAAHRQGFRSLSDIKTMILEPSGTVFLERKEPPMEEQHFRELRECMARIEDRLATITAKT